MDPILAFAKNSGALVIRSVTVVFRSFANNVGRFALKEPDIGNQSRPIIALFAGFWVVMFASRYSYAGHLPCGPSETFAALLGRI